MKYILALITCLVTLQIAEAQNKEQTVTLNDTTYFVYPFRVEPWALDIPPCGLKLQDGRYIAFTTYHYSERKAHKRPKLIDRDTNAISVVFTLVNNVPEGTARFFAGYKLKPGAGAGKLKTWYQQGCYKNGLKDGAWTYKTNNNIQVEHYRNGLKNGPSYWKKIKPSIENTNYRDGKPAGRSYLYDEKGKLSSIHYYDSLGLRDTVYIYKNGKLSEAYDLRNSFRLRPENNIWYETLSTNYINTGSRDMSFSFLRTYDDKGRLDSDVKLPSDTSYYFDSFLYNNKKITVKETPCEPGCKSKACYMVEEYGGTFDYSNQKFYDGNRLYRAMFVRNRSWGKKLALPDTSYEFYYEQDTTIHNPWREQILKKLVYKDGVNYTKIIPALGYTYIDYSKGGTAFHSNSVEYFFLTGSFDLFSGLPPLYIDSVQGFACFTDTASVLNDRVKISNKILAKPLSPPKENQYMMDYRVYEPVNLLTIESNTILHNTLDIGLMEDVFDRFNFPEQVRVGGNLYSGMAFYNNKKNSFTPKLLKLNNNTIGADASFLSRGHYLNGNKDGAWEFTDGSAHVNSKSDFKANFYKQKNTNVYYTAVFKNGLLNGPLTLYNTHFSDIWEMSDNHKVYKHLEEKRNYVNDTLHGPFEKYSIKEELVLSANYNKGQLDGPVKQFSDGRVIYEAQFHKDMLHGELRQYDYSVRHNLKTRATFYENKLNGLLEMYDSTKWLEAKADTGLLRYKKLFYENGALKEEITLDAGRRYLADASVINSFNFFEYANIPHENNIYNRRFPVRRVIRHNIRYPEFDSLNTSQFCGSYKSYYNNGQLYCQGRIENMKPSGTWDFYNETGALIHHVAFRDSSFHLPGDTSLVKSLGVLTGYFYNGKPRCRAFITSIDVSYDCNTKNDLSAFETVLIDSYDFFGKDNCVNGSGPVKSYNENGLLKASGHLENYIKTGIWKYYDPNQKLYMMGKYVNNQMDGVWFEGDLEGLNYEDAACIDPNNPYAVKQYQKSLKELKIIKRIYKNGELIDSDEHYIDMNRN
ncbi:MAG: hypothetical protein JST26_17820 [Bacteroidetes bacterium]|nr:hypothetical protein [Bacteroidota bacterium]